MKKRNKTRVTCSHCKGSGKVNLGQGVLEGQKSMSRRYRYTTYEEYTQAQIDGYRAKVGRMVWIKPSYVRAIADVIVYMGLERRAGLWTGLRDPEWSDRFGWLYSNSLDHASDPELALSVWYEQLRVGGIALLHWSEGHDHDRGPDATDCFMADPEEYRDLLREAGFSRTFQCGYTGGETRQIRQLGETLLIVGVKE